MPPPPAYGENIDQIQLSQPGFEAGAAVTDDGRVNININQKNQRLADLLSSTIRQQPQVKVTPADSLGPLPPAYIPPSLGGQPGQTPPPRLNVVIQIVGSRGDVQPFIALGQVLRDTYGHRVRVATHPTFQKFVEDSGLEFFSIGGDPAELMAFMVKNPGLMPGVDALKNGEIKRRRQGIEQIIMGCWRSCIEAGNGLGAPPRRHRPDEPVDERLFNNELSGGAEKPFVADAIIANPPSFAHIHIAEKMGIPMHMMFTMPWSPTRAFAHPLANIESTNTDVVMTNYVSYALVEMMTWQGLGDVINRFRTKVLDLEPLSLIWAPGLLSRLRIPTTYCWSPALIPKPADWGAEVTISGFFFLNLASSYTPDPELAAFLRAGPPPVYIGFGSIVVDDPNAMTRMILDAISIAGVRALVSKGWGGLGADAVGLPDGVFMLGNVPHDWLFQHVSAVVHHGGAGTSAAGIKLGKPTVVVPFFGDQPFWGAMIAKAGAGPMPIPYKKLTAEKLAAAVLEALKPETQTRAKELGAKISEEQGPDVGGKSFHEFLSTDNMRCSLAPSRVAVWRVRRTKTRLSALAGAVLVKEGYLKYSDLKLYRSIEYSTEDQPWDPITAVTSALVGDLGTMAMAVGDFPRELFAGAKKKSSEAPAAGREGGGPADSTASTSSSQAPGSETLVGADRSFSSSHLSVTASSGQRTPSSVAPASSTDLPRTTSQQTATTSSSNPKCKQKLQAAHKCGGEACEATGQITLETAMGAGRGVGRIIESGMLMPQNVCLGLARGFRNAPRLYSDDTVRPMEKVTDFASGIRVAGKEFGLGMFDGISGLVTQPLRGAEKEGVQGLIKGFGKGIGGLMLKPAAAVWSIPAYTMQGVHAEVRNMFSKSSTNYIITSRVLQGKEDLQTSSVEEKKDILLRWQARKAELKGFYNLKQKESSASASGSNLPNESSSTTIGSSGDSTTEAGGRSPSPQQPAKTGWFHTRNLSFDERKRLHAQKDAEKKNKAATAALDKQPSHTLEDEEFERAIRASVAQTSRGDKEEDARVEAAIRNSVKEMRRIAEAQEQQQQTKTAGSQPTATAAAVMSNLPDGEQLEDLSNVTDEEYQALVEEAVKRSLAAQTAQQGQRSGGGGGREEDDSDGDEEFLKALEASRTESFGPGHQQQQHPPPVPPRTPSGNVSTVLDDSTGAAGEDEQMRRAIEESERAHREQVQLMERQRTEEDIVMEYVKKQSLAEEEYRRTHRGPGGGEEVEGKGKDKEAVARADGEPGDVDEEDLRRALELSLRPPGGSGGPGPSNLMG
ncbi:glycosyltransferase family 28 domain-containing protein [Apodospora peruviana]|uniref:Glycosyltransferase family 28 domain-containing protein n=1 Tax=Apodospora peruviana TaxID=516989 RepID=A0AAE0IQZ9_9PEZI|nr:glycosyltransferase family 28 domain-containing protein [Apodospora peruviana]